MPAEPSVLRDLQEAVTARLRSSDKLSVLKIYDRRDGNIENSVNTALAGVGVTIFVSPVLPKGFSPNVPAPCFKAGDFTVRIIEAPTTNQTGLDVYALSEIVIRRLHYWTPPVQDAGTVTVDEDPIDDNSVPAKGRAIWDVLFHVSGSMEAGYPDAPEPDEP